MAKMMVGMIRRASRSAPKANDADEEEGDKDPDEIVAQQKKTFRRWVNSYLVERQLTVHHILNDWESGVLLCNLVEVLAKTNLPKINQAPKLEVQKLENLNNALAFIGKHVKIVNIGSRDIYSANQTIILGLIWTLIIRWGVRLKDGKAGLLAWVNEKTGAEATGFTNKDWKDGMLMARLVAAVCPGKLDLSACSADDALNNFAKSFDVLEAELDVAKLLDPKDMVEKIDEKSLVAFIGQVHKNLNRDPNEIAAEKMARAIAAIKSINLGAPRVYNITPVSAEVAWVVPQGKGITAVKVQLAAKDDEQWPEEPGEHNKEVFEDRSSTTFIGLAPEHSYKIRIQGLHSTGKLTEPSETVVFSTLEAGAPEAPRLVDVTTQSITCEWQEVATATAYKVIVDDANGEKFREIPVQGRTRVVVEGLEAGSPYTFRVIATLPEKDTSPSAASETKTLMPTPESAPVVSDLTDRSATLTVVPVAGAVRYEVQLKNADSPWASTSSEFAPLWIASPETSVMLAELEPDRLYEVRVIAVSAAGVASEASPVAAFATEGAAARYALITGANSKAGVDIVQSLLLLSTTSGGEVGATTSFGFSEGFTKVYCLAREPLLPELAHLAEETRTLEVIVVDVNDSKSVAEAAKHLPSAVDLLINNASVSKSVIMRLLS